MTVPSKIQSSFAGGVFSPELYSRVDLKKYQIGLKTGTNFIVHPQGGVSNRAGFYFAAKAKDVNKKTRILPFIFSKTQAYVLEFGDEYVRFFLNKAQVVISSADSWVTATVYEKGDYVDEASTIYYCLEGHTSGTFSTDLAAGKWVAQTIYQVPLPYGEDDLADLRITSSADTIYIFHPDFQTRTLSRYGTTDWRVDLFSPTDGPFMVENVTTSTTVALSAVSGTGVTLVSSAEIFNDDHVNALWKVIHYIEGQTVTAAFTSATASSSISCFTTWRIISHGTWTGKFRIEKSIDGGSTWTNLREFTSSNDFNANTYGVEDEEANPTPFLVRVRANAYTSGTINIDLTTDPFYQNGIVKINTVTNTTACVVDVLTAAGSTAATASWAEGSWSTYRGFPADGTFHQDRFCAAATAGEPMTFWMSKVGQYTKFGRFSTTLDTDGISVRLLSRQVNIVNSLTPLTDLIATTTGAEWNIGADGVVITPTTITSRVQGYRGSNGLKPVVIGNQMIYVQANGKVVRNLGYDFASDSFTGTDLRILSSHLFNGHEIIDIAYQQDPDSIVWAVRDDGVLLSMTYMAEQEVIAWTPHETDGDVESICVIPGNGYDELWLVVNRDGGRYIEYMVERMASTDPHLQFFVDSGLQHNVPVTISNATKADPVVITATAHGFNDDDIVYIENVAGMTEINKVRFKVANKDANTFELTEEDSGDNIDGSAYTAYSSGGTVRKCYATFSGLDHLEGQDVAILADGEVYPQQEIISGEVTISRACAYASIGLPYTADFETLNIEVGLKSGTMQGKPVKISEVVFRILNSRGGYIGPNFDTLYEGFIPERESLGTAPNLFSGDISQGLAGGWEEGGRVCYRQIDPLPITITAVIPSFIVA